MAAGISLYKKNWMKRKKDEYPTTNTDITFWASIGPIPIPSIIIPISASQYFFSSP